MLRVATATLRRRSRVVRAAFASSLFETPATPLVRYRSHSAVLEKYAPMYTKSAKRTRADEDDEDENMGPNPTLNVNRVAFIGGGNMAEAIITGMMTQELLPPSQVLVSAPSPETRDKFDQMHVETVDKNKKALVGADVVIVAVKPQVLKQAVFEDLKKYLDPNALVISIVAGVTIDAYKKELGPDTCIVRSMPNTPAMIGEGITVWTQSSNVSDVQHDLTKKILGAFGKQVFVADEKNLDMATALSGSGPAYFFLVAEAMIDAGVHMGFSRTVAQKLVQQTMLGSALYMQSSGLHPVVLRNNITSPGGTTAAAMYRAEKNGFRAVIADSIWAAYDRSKELGAQAEAKSHDH
ncbi:pyrroline-5-carboxylate reductase [Saprolegnia diclina VS20]|uniref:Pyrroline-5-carboxylate reductase n=1 Tax=Saprolegnia diclina (strain VS20) TaxID=1156394 RepID=T0S9F0_SAPDV|nr:pyrroline-5-carboxylate reductase [Saprolegnia diclina VS20]EQC39337.1 pyrroline-5-carboxylate reductase [Saprolegnia diclina VS20]|eukprot:XP_008607398.1 pyrroline-5-carboxylate reductase [Saprolegnia diclina VS20]